jgi:hypothetical protein
MALPPLELPPVEKGRPVAGRPFCLVDNKYLIARWWCRQCEARALHVGDGARGVLHIGAVELLVSGRGVGTILRMK